MSVTSGADTNTPGTLRYAIESTTASVIVISPTVGTITLEAPLIIPRSVSIYGNGVNLTYSDTVVIGGAAMISTAVTGTLLSLTGINFLGNPANPDTDVVAINGSNLSSLIVSACSFRNFLPSLTTLIRCINTNASINKTVFQNNTRNAGLFLMIVQAGFSQPISVVLDGCQFLGNSLGPGCVQIQSQSIASSYIVSVTCNDLLFDNNTRTGPGSSSEPDWIAVWGNNGLTSSILMSNITITNNTTANSSNGITITGSTRAYVELENIRVENNVSTGVATNRAVGLTLTSTAMSGRSGQTILRNINIRNNVSSEYAGIYMDLDTFAGESQVVSLDNISIIGNTTTDAAINGSLVLTGIGAQYNLNNVMVGGNQGGLTGGIYVADDGAKTFRNVSIADNVGTTIGGLRVETGSTPPLLYNTLIGDNWSNIARTVRSDALGIVDAGSSNNLVSNGVTLVGITDGSQGNQIGTDLAPIDPVLGSAGNYGGANNFWVVPLLEGSPAINAGNNTFIAPDTPFDVRGDPLTRIYDSVVDIGAFEWQPFVAPCFLADSLVKVKEIETGAVSYKRADEIKSVEHEVFDVLADQFVPIKFIAKIEGVESAYLIQSGLFGENKPFADLTITAGHPVMIDNKPVKAKDVPGAIKVDFERTNVYSIVCEKWRPIDVNGIGVYAWSEKKWLKHVQEACVVYSKC